MDKKSIFKSGFVAIIGRPNTGKSTFLNALLDAKVSIVSPKPQTTWRTIKGIHTDERGQIIFLDAPGMHDPKDALNIAINNRAKQSADEADVILHFIDSSRYQGAEDAGVDVFLGDFTKPIIKVFTKSDIATKKLPPEVLSICSNDKKGFAELLTRIYETLPEGPLYYDEECYTDQSVSERVEEIVREKIYETFSDEIPYGILIELAHHEIESDRMKLLVYIFTEKESVKPIIIGKQGSMLSHIGSSARKDLEKIFGKKIRLDLRVKVLPKWRKNPNIVKRYFS